VSGIAAVFRRDGRAVDPDAMRRMLDRLAARGPDASGAWREGPVALGHRMLHDTPESLLEPQPRVAERGDLVVTADARLDNREELFDLLGLRPALSGEIGDAELILRAWERWGEECPTRLLGDFAFALWDTGRRTLFCVRDPGGLKPLYYHSGPRLVAVASEVKALLALSEVPRVVNDLRIAASLTTGVDVSTDTFFVGVSHLAPGHLLAAGDRPGEPRAFWRLDPSREIRYRGDAEYAEAFRERFADAVRRRLRSAFPVATALSGGLDSSSVTAMARALREGSGAGALPTYSAIFPSLPACDERPFIEAVVDQGGVLPRFVHADELDPLQELQHSPWHEDETLCEPGFYMHWALYRAASRDGVRVYLEGTAGDQVVSHGTGVLRDLVRRGRWLTLARQSAQLGRSFEASTWRVLRVAVGAAASPALRRGWRRLRQRGRLWAPILRSDVARRLDLVERLHAHATDAGQVSDGARRAQWHALTSSPQLGLKETQAGLAGASGIDVRDPFLDRRLVEFCLALPVEQKIRGGVTRVVMRHAMASLLPARIVDRPGKARLFLMVPRALEVAGREHVDGLVQEARRLLGSYLDLAVLDRTYRRYLEHGRPADAAVVFQIVALTAWLRRVFSTAA
jgi:asparagine synthase (glutamine-hydrolysing)